jgi:hypothetical protein
VGLSRWDPYLVCCHISPAGLSSATAMTFANEREHGHRRAATKNRLGNAHRYPLSRLNSGGLFKIVSQGVAPPLKDFLPLAVQTQACG